MAAFNKKRKLVSLNIFKPAFSLWLVFLLVFQIIAGVLLFPPIEEADAAWLSDYLYRKQINISKEAGAGTNYQVKLLIGKTDDADNEHFDLNGNCLDTFNDIRFTDNDETALLDYWIESVADSGTSKLATVWVEVADDLTGIPPDTHPIYIYYGNSSASSASDGSATFLGGTDFEQDDGFTIYDDGNTESYGNQTGEIRTGSVGHVNGFQYESQFAGNAQQGIASDGTYIYTVSAIDDWLRKYDKSGGLQAERDITGDGTYSDCGGITYYNNKIYVTSVNYPSTPEAGNIREFNSSDLTYVGEHSLGTVDQWPGDITFRDNHFWVIWNKNPVKLRKFNTTWNIIATYDLSQTSPTGTYHGNGIEMIGNYLYLNWHEHMNPECMDIYYWNGSGFDFVERISHQFNGYECGQDLCLDPLESNVMWWSSQSDGTGKAYKTTFELNQHQLTLYDADRIHTNYVSKPISSISDNFAIRGRVKVGLLSQSSGGYDYPLFSIEQTTGQLKASGNCLIGVTYTPENDFKLIEYRHGSGTTAFTVASSINEWHTVEIRIDGTTGTLDVDGSTNSGTITNDNRAHLKAINHFIAPISSQTYTAYEDWFWLRKYAADEPAYFSAGAETAVNNIPSAVSVSNLPDLASIGSNITFTGNWAEPDSGDLVKMYVCKDSSCTNCNNISQTNCWCHSFDFQTEPDTSDTCVYATTQSDIGDNNYWLGVCDDESSCDTTPLSGGTFTVQPTIQFTQAISGGAESSTPANLELTLSVASGQNITVDYTVTGGTATGGGKDYTLANGAATILAGETTITIDAVIVDDSINESNETIIVTISNPTNAILGTNTVHTYTISDNDTAQEEEKQKKEYSSSDGKIYKNLKNTSSSNGKVSYSKEPNQSDLINLKITPSFGEIEITIEVWSTSGDYYKKWKEDASSKSIISEHIAGDLKENISYQVFVDGSLFGTYTSNSSGEISFTYDKGYSEKTFEIKEGEVLAETGKRAPLLYYLLSFLFVFSGVFFYLRQKLSKP